MHTWWGVGFRVVVGVALASCGEAPMSRDGGSVAVDAGSVARCMPSIETQTLACAPGETGERQQQRRATCPTATGKPVWSEWVDTLNSCVADMTSCTFASNTVPNGATVTAYASAGVTAGETCRSEQRTCTNGVLSGTYAFATCATCTPQPPQMQTPTCPSGQTGMWAQRRTSTCPSGAASPVWSAWMDTTNTCAPPCMFGGQAVANGAAVTAYASASVPDGQTCTSETRTCTQGVLLGSYTFARCVVGQPMCVPASPATQTQTLTCPSGQTGTWIQSRTSSCPANASSPVWSAWTDSTNTCAASASPCTFNTTTLAHGQSVFAYATSSVAAGQCTGQQRTCNNGTLSGTFHFAACTAPVPTARVKNIITFQVGGWGGVTTDLPGADLEWPAYGGQNAYRARSGDILTHQLGLIAGLGPTVAVGVLLMTDSDSAMSGYGACWNGTWSGGAGCDSGTLTRPFGMYDALRTAAQSQGVRYVPDFSLMNYDGVRGTAVLPKLQQAMAWWRTRLPDPYAAKAPSGRYYVILDSLPSQLGLSAADTAAFVAYLHSQTDVEWIDNMLNASTPPGNTNYTGNLFHSTWGDEATKDYLNSLEGDHFLWWFQANQVVRTFADFNSVTYKIPEATRLKWLNIAPHSPTKYPVNISQWNEYAEYLIYEPSTRSGTANYDYLRWRISQQP